MPSSTTSQPSVTTSSTTSSVASTAPGGKAYPTVITESTGRYAFQGCWNDSDSDGRALPYYYVPNDGTDTTRENCVDYCSSNSYAYAGVEYVSPLSSFQLPTHSSHTTPGFPMLLRQQPRLQHSHRPRRELRHRLQRQQPRMVRRRWIHASLLQPSATGINLIVLGISSFSFRSFPIPSKPTVSPKRSSSLLITSSRKSSQRILRFSSISFILPCFRESSERLFCISGCFVIPSSCQSSECRERRERFLCIRCFVPSLRKQRQRSERVVGISSFLSLGSQQSIQRL